MTVPLRAPDPASPPDLVYAECCYCSEGLIFRADGSGWVHRLGGLIFRRCLNCEVSSSSWGLTGRCPLCGESEVVDDHVATARRS